MISRNGCKRNTAEIIYLTLNHLSLARARVLLLGNEEKESYWKCYNSLLNSKRVKIDLHVHSESSYDCLTKIEDFKRVFDFGKIDKIAITDHSKIDLAFKLKELFGDKIIIGEEIMTNSGEIIGLFLTQQISRDLSPEKTIEEIRKQNGVVYIPHPFDKRRAGIYKYENYISILKQADVIEVFNSRCFTQLPNRLAQAFAKENKKLQGIGSDAHNWHEIGSSIVEIDDFSNASEFLKNLSSVNLIKRKTKLRYAFTPTMNKIIKKFI